MFKVGYTINRIYNIACITLCFWGLSDPRFWLCPDIPLVPWAKQAEHSRLPTWSWWSGPLSIWDMCIDVVPRILPAKFYRIKAMSIELPSSIWPLVNVPKRNNDRPWPLVAPSHSFGHLRWRIPCSHHHWSLRWAILHHCWCHCHSCAAHCHSCAAVDGPKSQKT